MMHVALYAFFLLDVLSSRELLICFFFFLFCVVLKENKEENKGEEKKEEAKGEQKKEEEKKGEKKEEEPPEIVLKVDMHCKACARKIARALKGFEGIIIFLDIN